jgi:hypothetical protein
MYQRDAKYSGGGSDVGEQLVHLGDMVARLYEARSDATLGQHQPGQNIGWKITFHQQDFIALAPGDAVRQQVQPVGSAVAENDFFGGSVDQPAERLLQFLRDAAEALGREKPGGALPGDGLLSRGGGDSRQRPLMRAVEPELAFEGAEVLRVITDHPLSFVAVALIRISTRPVDQLSSRVAPERSRQSSPRR